MPENGSVNGGAGRDSTSSTDRPDRDDNNNGGAREAKESFEREMSNANRPDRTPASPSETTTVSDDDDDDNSKTTDKPDDKPDRAAGPSSIGASPSSTSPPDTAPTDTANETDEEDEETEDRGVLDRVGDFFGGLAKDVQDFSRDNPRVDSYGNPVGHVDADGIQRGEVASRVRSSGTSSTDLANQLGFTSPQDMAAAQNTDFIEDKLKEDKAAEMEAAIEERYGTHPDLAALNVDANRAALANGDVMLAGYDDVGRAGLKGLLGRALGPLGFLLDTKPLNQDQVPPDEDPEEKSLGGHNVEDLAGSGAEPDLADKSRQLTKAGRALDKHGHNRSGSGAFDKPSGGPADKNAQGQKALEDIVNDEDATVNEGNKFGGFDIYDSDGKGARFDSEGKFRGFLEPDG